MDLLQKLEARASEFWQQAQQTRDPNKKQQLLKLHREFYQKYKKQKQWLAAIGEQ